MNTVKPWRNSSLPPSPKKRFPSWIKMLPALLLSSLIGTYLDLFYVGLGYYSFPFRPMYEIFTINIAFTLVGLPVLMACFLMICSRFTRWNRAVFIILLGLIMPLFERIAEKYGWFIHSEDFHHAYSFFGYTVFFSVIYLFHQFVLHRWK